MTVERVTCIDTGDYEFSLVLNAVYETLPDDVAAEHKLIRVVDESGEDYLYPESYFVPVEAVVENPDLGIHTSA